MRVSVLGAGAWGTALAASIAPRHDTLLWARDAAQAALIDRSRRNERYLPGVDLPAGLRIDAAFGSALSHAAGDGLIVVATPMSGLREMVSRCAEQGRGLWWLCKGFEAGSGALGHEVARDVAPEARVGVLSGPSFALEVAGGQPTALVAASADAALRQQALEVFHSESLRIYTSADPIGVEVGGAVKNVLAIATGIGDGMALGLNARAALITRGLAEMTRLGLALGARADTFMGLSGLGDLVLTATGDLSRNRQVGLQLARGGRLPEVLVS
uniref:NAD(P)H-dependent glycerol-3-phosphate dehydrogenase n=1 Tax=Methylibium sp. TaxID=2067992 RepID=UPI0017DC63F7